jgi:hypothetical protein
MKKYSSEWNQAKDDYGNRINYDPEFAKKWGDAGPIYPKQWRRWSKFREEKNEEKLYIKNKEGIFVPVEKKFYVEEEVDQVRDMIEGLKKKPTGTDIWPTKANYQIDYAPDGDLWQLQYGKIELEFRVNWKARLFRRNYQIDAEMMITDWVNSKQNSLIREDQRLKPNAIMSESTLGFTDTDFWGEYTIIEPDSSIEKILDKIKRQLERLKEE